jgi:hypothetical protein
MTDGCGTDYGFTVRTANEIAHCLATHTRSPLSGQYRCEAYWRGALQPPFPNTPLVKKMSTLHVTMASAGYLGAFCREFYIELGKTLDNQEVCVHLHIAPETYGNARFFEMRYSPKGLLFTKSVDYRQVLILWARFH